MREFNNDNIVYVNTAWGVAEKCKVLDYIPEESSTGKNVYKLYGIENYGTFGATEERVFRTKEDAIAAHKKEDDERVKKYKKEIKSVKDLIEFPLVHCINGSEYTDYAAKKAYKLRAKELLDVDVKE